MTDPRSTPSIPVGPEERRFCVDCGHWDHAPGGCDGLGHIFTEEWVPVVTDCTCEVHDDEREARPTPVEPEAPIYPDSVPLDTPVTPGTLDESLWDDDSRPVPLEVAVEPDGLPLDVERLAVAIRLESIRNGQPLSLEASRLYAHALNGEYARLASTPSEAKP